ncbi:3-hydroxyacyl-CoA dehydrogenase [Halomonas huangheensis]|uniref:3-hydroxyacyl-CoA dehydrogenase n=1 Tax=Halomonas huangheensis TaxID=1178482 RepID=UPI0004279ACC|nr:3-hydroxyacyl-CoA dehydrogenase [Halomonas huangheensis]ALM54264.1 3-hydroxyacyl-CoA dehydrogenase [Halomonas huangheensis]
MKQPIAVVGAGLIGRAWAVVFARAGYEVRLYDADADVLQGALDAIAAGLDAMLAEGVLDDANAVLTRVTVQADMATALRDVGYVQECGPENLAIKRELLVAIEQHVSDSTVLASSTSGIPASEFGSGLQRPERCLVAHPINPPSLIPLVEVVPAPATDQHCIDATMQLMADVGQQPILVKQEVQGFVLNRLQGALLNEALRLYRDGVVSVDDLDKTLRYGLGWRWAFMGPMETIDLNAPGGIADYGHRYGPLYRDIDAQRRDPAPWHDALLDQLQAERRQLLPMSDLEARQQWRDRRLMTLRRHLLEQS